MILENLFKQFEVPLWGIGSLEKVVQHTHEYKYIVFCLPYESAAIEALPDDRLMNLCKSDLGERTKTIYNTLIEELNDCTFVSYDDVDREFGLGQKGISQKVLGHLAGLGWIGRSSLLVTPKFGPRVRLGTMFTKDDIGFTGQPFLGSCGECMACSEVCPSSAISKHVYDTSKCRQIVTNAQGKYKMFCGLCMQVCPIGTSTHRMQQTRTNHAVDAER
ncbi:MAG: hypothetical protein SVW57_13105 [Thermodesulfobacteriota bacterium]|nr:hypothetical protein [Thermodesulfobacteriota bacterium]